MDISEAVAQEADLKLIREFELDGRRLTRLAQVDRAFGDSSRAAEIEKQIEIISRKIHFLKTGEVLDAP